jgi:GDP-4-dehydro-6-deoxy-D-mannose reductase
LKALITGISGFVGTHLTEYLLRETDCEVAGTVYGPMDSIAQWQDQLHLYPAELSRLETVSSILSDAQPDLIFHLAAQPLPALSFKDPWFTLETNIRVQLNVLEAVRQLHLPARVLVVGSSEEYGAWCAPTRCPLTEDQPVARPMSPYAVSKIAQDMLGLQYFLSYGSTRYACGRSTTSGRASGWGSSCARPGASRWPRPKPACASRSSMWQSACEPRFQRRARRGARLLSAAWTRGQAGEVYNVGSGQARSVRSILEGLLRLSRIPLTYREDVNRVRAVDVPHMRADCSRLRAATGWEPRISLQQSLQDILDYWRARVQSEPAAAG